MKQITNIAEFETEVLKSEKPIVVDFFTEWCGPCKALAPILEEISQERDDILLVKVDAGDLDDLTQKYGVQGFPTIIYFKNGEATSSLVGLQSKKAIIQWIEQQS